MAGPGIQTRIQAIDKFNFPVNVDNSGRAAFGLGSLLLLGLNVRPMIPAGPARARSPGHGQFPPQQEEQRDSSLIFILTRLKRLGLYSGSRCFTGKRHTKATQRALARAGPAGRYSSCRRGSGSGPPNPTCLPSRCWRSSSPTRLNGRPSARCGRPSA